MSIIVPIFVAALIVGLRVKRMTAGYWLLLILWISSIVAYHLMRRL